MTTYRIRTWTCYCGRHFKDVYVPKPGNKKSIICFCGNKLSWQKDNESNIRVGQVFIYGERPEK
jgi:hypothetical protein